MKSSIYSHQKGGERIAVGYRLKNQASKYFKHHSLNEAFSCVLLIVNVEYFEVKLGGLGSWLKIGNISFNNPYTESSLDYIVHNESSILKIFGS